MKKFVCGMHINIEVFFKLILSFWVCVASHARSVQNKKFAYLCNLSRKTWDEVDFLLTDKDASFLQGVSITLVEQSQACPKYTR